MQRYLFMKLMYHDTAPESYDPPYFKSLPEDQGIGHFSRKPFSMCVFLQACDVQMSVGYPRGSPAAWLLIVLIEPYYFLRFSCNIEHLTV